jgi:hypothetical protein
MVEDNQVDLSNEMLEGDNLEKEKFTFIIPRLTYLLDSIPVYDHNF